MNSPRKQISVHDPGLATDTGEETLRLIARLSAPQGLEKRVQAGLKSGLRANPRPEPASARLLRWPVAPRLNSAWMRTAAAAAIVFVVAGGGWGVYSRVGTARNIAPPQSATQGGFSSSGAMRTPQTLHGPVVAPPAAKAVAKSGTPSGQKAAHPGKLAASGKNAVPAVTPPAK
jgi:hypothetical protein